MEKKTARPFQKDISPDKTKNVETGKTDVPGKKKKKRSKCYLYGCLVAFLLFVIFPLYAITASGVVHIPGISALTYGSGPKPMREVKAENIKLEDVGKKFEQIAKMGKNEITLTESELTALLQEDGKSLKDVNIAIDEDEIEFFGFFNEQPLNTYITAGIKPEVEGKKLKMKLSRARIGKLPVPVWAVNFAVDQMMRNSSLSDITDQGIQKVELEDGSMKLTGDLASLFQSKDKK